MIYAVDLVYLEYQKVSGYVVKIHADEPATVPEVHGIHATGDFSPGDEFQYCIYVTLAEGEVTGTASVQQAPPATYLLQRLADKDQEIKELKQELATTQEALDFIIMGGM